MRKFKGLIVILEKIIQDRKKAIALEKNKQSLSDLIEIIKQDDKKLKSLKESLCKKSELSIIAEIKRASPSKGLLSNNFDHIKLARDYEKGGAAALSVLTEPKYFLGESNHLMAISKISSLPILRKDFIIDIWQIYEARAIGADAILLIVAALKDEEMASFMGCAAELGLECLVEVHDESEVKRAIEHNAKIIGINNRDLKNFTVSLKPSKRLGHMLPKDCVMVSESGIHTREDMLYVQKLGFKAALIGESLIKAENAIAQLAKLQGLL